MNILKWPSGDGEKVYDKFACIIGQEMETENSHNFHQMLVWRVNSTNFYPELRNEFNFFSNLRDSIPQLFILNSEMKDLHWYLVWLSCNIKHITAISNLHFQQKIEYINISNVPQVMEKWFMANLHTSLDSTWKSRISIISTRCQNLEWGSIQQLFILKSEMNLKIFPIWGCFIPQLLILNSEMKDLHWYLIWLSCNIKHITAISNLHFNRKQSTLTYSNVPQVMKKWFMANLHASLDSTWKSRISIISTRFRLEGQFHNFSS